ncbi:hypothetical protein [Nocardioides sp. P5_C9_2]
MRTPIIVTAALVAVTALAGCAGDDGTDGGEPAPTAPASSPASPEQTAEDEAAAAPAIMIGDRAYVSPCRLLSPTDAADLFPLTEEAEFTEHGRATSTTPEELADMKGTVSGQRVPTSCDYSFGDAAGRHANLGVDQFTSEARAMSEWRTFKRFGDAKIPPRVLRGGISDAEQSIVDLIEDARVDLGGVRLPGLDERILWRVGTHEFVATADNLFLTFTRKRDAGFTDDLTEKDAALAERVLTRALDRVGDPEGLGETADPWFVQDDDWPTFLDPCSLLDEEAVESLFPATPLAEVDLSSVDAAPDVNLAAETPAARSHDSSCDRQDATRDHYAELTVQYVAPQDDAEKVLDSHLSNLVFGDPSVRPGRVRTIRAGLRNGGLYDVDASYLLATRDGDAYYYALLDRYVIELKARQLTKGSAKAVEKGELPEYESVDALALQTGMEAVVANLVAATDGDVGGEG